MNRILPALLLYSLLLLLPSEVVEGQEKKGGEEKQTLLLVDYDYAREEWKGDAGDLDESTFRGLLELPFLRVKRLEEFGDLFTEDPYLLLASCTEKEVCLLLMAEKVGADFILYGRFWREGDTNYIKALILGSEDEMILNSITIPFGHEYRGEMVDILKDFVSREAGYIAVPVKEESQGDVTEEGGTKVELPERVRLDFEKYLKGRGERQDKERERALRLKGLEAERGAEGLEKEWEKAGLEYSEYIDYLRSGLSLREWKRRKEGRRKRFILQAGMGWHLSSFSLEYLHLKARDPYSMIALDEYSYQGIGDGESTFLSGGIGYGISEYLEADLSLFYAPSHTDFYYYTQIGDESFTLTESDFHRVKTGAMSLSASMRYFFFFFPRLKPYIAGGLFYDHFFPLILESEEWKRFSSPWSLGLAFTPGLSFLLYRPLSIFFEFPFRLRVTGRYDETYDTGGEYIDRNYIYEPPSPFYISPHMGVELVF